MRVMEPHPVLKIDSTRDGFHVDSVQSRTEIFLTFLSFCSHVDSVKSSSRFIRLHFGN